MKFGIYVENVGNHEISKPAFEAANTAVELPTYDDVALFFQNIGKKPLPNKFGMFNSTDIAYFTGSLVVTFLDGVKGTLKEVNDRAVYYYYGLEETKDLFGLLAAVGDPHVKVVANNKENFDYIRRVTGVEPIAICDDLKNISNTIIEQD